MRRGDRYTVPAMVAVGGPAGHLGELEACPVALVQGAGPWLARTLETYRAQRRLGLSPSDPTPATVQALLVLDDEAALLARAEAERAELERGP